MIPVVRNNVKRTKKTVNSIPDDLLFDHALNRLISILPKNYNFEIHKCIWKIRSHQVKIVALQFPEGLLMYACIISDIISSYGNVKTIILGDVTYGACCIDDYSADKLNATFLIHFGHSCLVPTTATKIKVLYIFVEIEFDPEHLVSLLKTNFPPEKFSSVALLGTVQFIGMVHRAKDLVQCPQFVVPQALPLSSGETLGCTSSLLGEEVRAMVFVSDGRYSPPAN
jgi:2-(3-amino-3-carboxypropyl)histidine synthase